MTKINSDPSSHNVLAETSVTTSNTREVRMNSEGFTSNHLNQSPIDYLEGIEAKSSTVNVTLADRNNSGDFTDRQLTYESSRQITYATPITESWQKAFEDNITPENIIAISAGLAVGPCLQEAAVRTGFSVPVATARNKGGSGLVTSIVRSGMSLWRELLRPLRLGLPIAVLMSSAVQNAIQP